MEESIVYVSKTMKSALVAQMDVHLTGDQEVVGSGFRNYFAEMLTIMCYMQKPSL